MKDRTVIYVIAALVLLTVSSLFMLRKAQSMVFIVRDVTDPVALATDIIPGKYFLVPADEVLLEHEASPGLVPEDAQAIDEQGPAAGRPEQTAVEVAEVSPEEADQQQEPPPTPQPIPEPITEVKPAAAPEPEPEVIPDEIIPNTETSYVRIEGFIPGRGRDRVTWSDSIANQSTTYVTFYQAEPFDLSQEDLFAGSGMQRLTAQIVTEDPRLLDTTTPQEQPSAQPDRLRLTASLPIHEEGRNQAYLIQGVDGLGRFDMDTEFIYKMVEQRAITIDGDLTDWDEIPILYKDPVEGLPPPGPDWQIIKMTVDDSSLFIYFTSAYRFQYEPTGSYSRVLLFFDLDADPETGYRYEQAPFALDDPKRFIGSEAILNGASLYRQSKGSFNDGEVSRITIAPDPSTATYAYELSIPLTVLRAIEEDLSAFRILFLSDGNSDLAPGNRHSILLSIPSSSASSQGTLNTEGGAL